MKKLIVTGLAGVLLFTSFAPLIGATAVTNESTVKQNPDKLPYRFKDPEWEKYTSGQSFGWPLPDAPSFSTGIYSMASANEVDYKENENSFYSSASSYKSSSNIEVYYKSNPSSSVRLTVPSGSKVVASNGGTSELKSDLPKTAVPAYNEVPGLDQLILEPSQGQWLVTNGFYSRNSKIPVKTQSTSSGAGTQNIVDAGLLEEDPWGIMGASSAIKPEDFLMGLSKAIYGPIQSRPLYLQSTPFRMSQKVTWIVSRPPLDKNGYAPPPTSVYKLGEWKVQDVSKIEAINADQSPPAPGETKTIDRGEYIVHPEGYLNNVYQRYRKDQNSYVSPNVYELYFTKLLQKGILDTSDAFANSSFLKSTRDSNFSFNSTFANKFYSQYHNYGQNSADSYIYPAWSPELGAVYSNEELTKVSWLTNHTDNNIKITDASEVLGQSFKVEGSNWSGVTKITAVNTDGMYMEKPAVITTDALRMIEKALRIEDGDMTTTEAEIITKKYGAEFLEKLSDNDRRTVVYLLAKGILNFENYQEYSNLYSTLNESFAYSLLYRVANKDARMNFKEITMTDNDYSFSNFLQYHGIVIQPQLDKLVSTGSLTSDGKLTTNGKDTLTVMSDAITVNNVDQPKNSEDVLVKISLDDILKYLYRGKPLVNVDSKGQPLKSNKSTSTKTVYQVYHQIQDKQTGKLVNIEVGDKVTSKNLLISNAASSIDNSTGIQEIVKDGKSKRWTVTFLSKGVDQNTATEFVKANLETKIPGLAKTTETDGAYTNGNPMVDLNLSSLASTLSKNGDLVVDKNYKTTAYSGDKSSIAGNTISDTPASLTNDRTTVSSLSTASALVPTIAEEQIGSKSVVAMDIPQLRKKPLPVYAPSGQKVGQSDVIVDNVTSVNSRGQQISAPFEMYNISQFNSTDTLIVKSTFDYTSDPDAKGNTTTKKVKGSIVLSWDLNLPEHFEQSSMVGSDVTDYVNDNVRSSWMFTKPKNQALLDLWNYNTGLNQAILKTFSGTDFVLPSGYFSPSISILVDSLDYRELIPDGEEVSYDLSSKQMTEIKTSITKKIGSNLPKDWVSNYIGDSAVANYVVPYPVNSKRVMKPPASNLVVSSTQTGVKFKLPTKLINAEVPNGETVWSALVFNQNPPADSNPTFLKNHYNLGSLSTDSIYTTQNGNYFYGHYYTGGEETGPPEMVLPYLRDNFGNLYKNFKDSPYRLDKASGVIRENSSRFNPIEVGKLVKVDDTQWRVISETDDTYRLLSTDFIKSVYESDDLFALGNGVTPRQKVFDSVAWYANSIFGRDRDPAVDEKKFFNTNSFDFVPSPEDIKAGAKFAAVQRGEMRPMVYKAGVDVNGKPNVSLEGSKLDKGDAINVPVYVTVSKNVWTVGGDLLVWQKTFAGANPDLYTRGTLVQTVREQLLEGKSKNLKNSQDLESGTLLMGSTTGVISGKKTTFLVPFKSEMLKGNEVNESLVMRTFSSNADLVVVNGKDPTSAAQYITDKKVAVYDPEFKGYKNTLVRKQNRLYLATDSRLTEYVPGATIDTVSLTGLLMEGLRVLNMGSVENENMYRIYSMQTIKPGQKVSPFNEGGPPTLNASETVINDTSTMFNQVSTSDSIMENLTRYLAEIRAKNAWYFVFFLILGLGVLMSITTVLAHVLAYAPISATIFTKIADITGVDLLAVSSLGAVRVGEENKWVNTVKTSAMLGVIPIVLFGLMQRFGLF